MLPSPPGRSAPRGILRPQPVVDLPSLQSVRLLDQIRERCRLVHYSLKTERTYVHWARAFIRFHGLRHPAEMSGAEVEAFLTHLAAERQLSPSSHRQALSALLFLYGKVLGQQLPWMQDIDRPVPKPRLPVVLGRDEAGHLGADVRGASPAGRVAVRHGHAHFLSAGSAREGRGFRAPRDLRPRGQRRQGSDRDAATVLAGVHPGAVGLVPAQSGKPM